MTLKPNILVIISNEKIVGNIPTSVLIYFGIVEIPIFIIVANNHPTVYLSQMFVGNSAVVSSLCSS